MESADGISARLAYLQPDAENASASPAARGRGIRGMTSDGADTIPLIGEAR
jgi:hypothetical protein